MSNIRVWVGDDGKWSEEISGLDKIHIIKDAILEECRRHFPFREEEDDFFLELDMEIDVVPISITKKDYFVHDLGEDRLVESANWANLEKRHGIQLASVKIVKIPLFTFCLISKKEKKSGHLLPVYKDMVKAAKVPKAILDECENEKKLNGYSLLLKFEEE